MLLILNRDNIYEIEYIITFRQNWCLQRFLQFCVIILLV